MPNIKYKPYQSGAERRTGGSQLKTSGAKQSLAPVLLMRNNHYVQDNGKVIGQHLVSEDIYNSIEAGKEYTFDGNFGQGKYGAYLRITNISGKAVQ